jgi:hypothetical protein
LEEFIYFENFNISENNIISVKLAKGLGYVLDEINICKSVCRGGGLAL